MSTLNDISKLHDAASRALRQGDSSTAEGLCRRILDADPQRFATGGRLSVFARRPGLVQIAFLGYPTTTGLTKTRGKPRPSGEG